MLPRIVFSVDGSPVDLADWSFSSSADLGFDQFRAVATNTRAKKVVGGIQQGSVVEAFTESGKRVWEGTVPQPPKLRQDGLAQVAAQGYAYRAAKSGNRLSPIIDNPGAWIPAYLDPVNYPVGGFSTDPVITNTLTTRRITFQPDGVSSENGFAFYAKGMNITRFSAELDAPAVGNMWRIITGKLTDVYGTRRIEYATTGSGVTDVKSIGSPAIPHGRKWEGTVEFLPSDVVIIELHSGAQVGIVGSSQKNITNPIVWGDYSAEVIYTHHAAKIVARQLGWDDVGVTGHGAAPLTSSDWVGDGATYMNYIAGLEDFCWGVWDHTGYGPLLTFGPYGRTTWQVSATTGAQWDLDPLEKVKTIIVQFLNVDSTLGEIRIDAPTNSELPAEVLGELKGSLNDAQTSAQLAGMVAWRTMQRMLGTRYRGRISLAHAYEKGSRRDAPYEVRGGDLIEITDFSLDGSVTLRVHDVEYGPQGVQVGIEAPALSLGAGVRGTGVGTGQRTLTTTETGGAAVYVPPGVLGGSDPGIIIDPFPSGGGGHKGGLDLGK